MFINWATENSGSSKIKAAKYRIGKCGTNFGGGKYGTNL